MGYFYLFIYLYGKIIFHCAWLTHHVQLTLVIIIDNLHFLVSIVILEVKVVLHLYLNPCPPLSGPYTLPVSQEVCPNLGYRWDPHANTHARRIPHSQNPADVWSTMLCQSPTPFLVYVSTWTHRTLACLHPHGNPQPTYLSGGLVFGGDF